ncbi:MAG: hypothetical protein HZA94_01335 [Candidatus Vogelbacteria bacterium]|nr:hypothetical protein [Candidatus Vogelbacteria bacterium]
MARKQKSICLFDFADTINARLIVTRLPNRKGTAFFCEFKDGNIRVRGGHALTSMAGEGRSPAEAMKNYATKVRGKKLVLNFHLPEERQEFIVPENLTAQPANRPNH